MSEVRAGQDRDRPAARRAQCGQREVQGRDAQEKAELGRQAKEAGARAAALEGALAGKEEELKALTLRLPGIPYEGAPVGPDERSNAIVRTVGEPREFDFAPLDHVALIEKNDWGDLSRVTQVSGSRTYCLKGALALLETKLMAWALERIAGAGFTPITVPAIAREPGVPQPGPVSGPPGRDLRAPQRRAVARRDRGSRADLAPFGRDHRGRQAADPLRRFFALFPPRGGERGRDVRGLLRVHQFVKVEQYVICEADDAQSAEWHARLLGLAEELLQALEIPYQVIETSTGDMGLGKYRMNDLESWVPSLEKYRETHSCSTLHDWQARRANMRYRGADGKVRFAHTLNNTALASPRSSFRCSRTIRPRMGGCGCPRRCRTLDGGRVSSEPFVAPRAHSRQAEDERLKYEWPDPDDRPALRLRLGEAAWIVPRLWRLFGSTGPRGPVDGPPALVIPGFVAHDRATLALRRALAPRAGGFTAGKWGSNGARGRTRSRS